MNYRGGLKFSGLVKLARDLREKQTPAEELFWELVRNRRFMGLKFRRQHQCADYILDFYCDDIRFAVELDGPIHAANAKLDCRRDADLAALGVTVIRIRNEELFGDPAAALRRIASRATRLMHPHPQPPLPEGEGEKTPSPPAPLPVGEGYGVRVNRRIKWTP